MARNPVMPRRLGNQASRKIFRFSAIGDVVGELRRVTWPSRQETMRLTLMVIAVSASVGIFLGVVDLGFTEIFGFILGR